MGFWDTLGEALGKKMMEARDNYNSAQENSERLSDEQLAKRFMNEPSYAKYGMELKKRQMSRENNGNE